jgi:peptide/nickel transport system substrate-binding protein
MGLISAGYADYGVAARAIIASPAWSALGDDAKGLYASLPDTSASDPQSAAQRISELGLTGKTVVFAYLQGNADMTAMANAALAAGNLVGLTVELREMAAPDFAALTSDPKAKSGIDMWPLAFRQASGDPLETYSSFISTSPLNYGGYVNAEYDRIASQALQTEDDRARAELTAELAAIAAADLPWIPLVEPSYNLFLSNDLTGIPTTAEGLVPWLAWLGSVK